VALCPPTIALDDGIVYTRARRNCGCGSCWLDYWRQVNAKRKALGADLYIILNGDMTEGSHHGSTQILSGNATAQAAVVDAVLKVPLALNPDRLWIIRGTEAHVGASACHEERIAKGLLKDGRPIVPCTETDTASHWHARIDVQGIRFDLAHHGCVGARSWTKGNVTNALAADLFANHCADGVPHPHIALRAHMHQFVDTGSAAPTRVLQSGAWQLATAFTHRIASRGKLAEVGAYIITVDDGEYDVKPVRYKPDPTPLWVAP
jgi:hypothetical protein